MHIFRFSAVNLFFDLFRSSSRYLYKTNTINVYFIDDPSSSLQPATRIPHQPNHTETPTYIEIRTHDHCGDILENSQALDDGCINVRNMLSIEEVK